jgi:hypothetical protein
LSDSGATGTGRYLWRNAQARERDVWWVPPGSAPREHLATTYRSSRCLRVLDEDDLVGVARTILHHATGDLRTAAKHAESFRAEALTGRAVARKHELSVGVVEQWLSARSIPLAPGWERHGPGPVIGHSRSDPSAERYTVALDGADLLRIDVADRASRALVAVTNLGHQHEHTWSRTIVIAGTGEDHHPAPPGRRVTTDQLPFGGWAVQIDGFDVAVLERDRRELIEARVAVYDRGPDSGFLVFDNTTRDRQPPDRPLAIGERLRQFTGTGGRDRVLGR